MVHLQSYEMTEQNMLRFDSQLIYCIESGSNDVAKGLLKRNLHEIKDVLGLLLHHAAAYDNSGIAEHLIKLGSDIDHLDYDSKTPLMIAMENGSAATVKVLLDADAKIDFADASGQTALQLIFASQEYADILVLFLERLQRDCSSADELLQRLIGAGSSMYHASFLRDTKLLGGLLERGIHVDSRGYCGGTALHAAVELDDLHLAKWLLDNNADANALDDDGRGPLYDAAYRGRVNLVRLLLEHGANPNVAEKQYDYTPLFATFAYSLGERDQNEFDACVKLLLQHGAIPKNSSVDRNTLFDYAVFAKSNDRINLLVAHLAMLDKLAVTLAKSVMYYNVAEHFSAQSQLDHNYELCWQLLDFNVYPKLSLFNLLIESKDKLRILVRDRMLISKIKYVDDKLGRIYPFYFEPLMKRVAEALHAVQLEDAAIPILCQIFDGNYNQCYYVAREIVGYLTAEDLEQLCRVV